MAAQSKLCTTKYVYNCYDVGHTWTPSCTLAAGLVLLDCIVYSAKIYSTLYVITFLIQRKKLNWNSIKKLLLEIIQSTSFLSWNGFAFVSSICILRRLIGYFFFLNAGFLPGFTASFTAILLERKSRRRLLAVYVLNVILDAIYRMAVSRGYFRPIMYGESLLFSASMAGFLYFYKRRDNIRDFTGKVLSYLIGFEEGGSTLPTPLSEWDSNFTTKPIKNVEEHKCMLWKVPWCGKLLWSLQQWLQKGPRHHLCLHNYSCHYYWILGFMKPFFIGYSIQTTLGLISSLTKILKRPSILKQQLTKQNNFKFGVFLGGFCAIFKFSNCLLRWLRNTDSPNHGLITGFLAGLAMILYPMPSLALYTFCKLMDILYTKGIDSGYCPSFPYGVELLYALVTGFMFHVAVLEPHNLRPSYWKFLMNLTNTRMGGINRHVLEDFGTQSAKMFPIAMYNYNHKYTSQALKDALKLTVNI